MHCFQGNENLGMVMIFTLVSAGQEWLNVRWDTIKKEREEQVLAKKRAEEEAEQVCDFLFYSSLSFFRVVEGM